MKCSKCGTEMRCTDNENPMYIQMQGEEYVCPNPDCKHYVWLDYDDMR